MISEELLQSFIAEASDLLDDVEPSLVEYSRQEDVEERTEIVNRVFRHFHSIKGSAGFVGLHEIARLTHEAETLLEQFRKAPDKIIPQDNITLLCRTVDLLRAIFANGGENVDENGGDLGIDSLIAEIVAATRTAKGASQTLDLSPSLETIKNRMDDAEKSDATQVVTQEAVDLLADAVGATPKPVPPADGGKIAPMPPVPGPGSTAVRESVTRRRLSSDTARIINTRKMASQEKKLHNSEFTNRYVTEANELLEQIEQSLLQAEQHPEASADAVQEALRCLHSFKGNSGFMNLADLERLSHRMESEVENNIGRTLGLDSQTFDALLQMIDVLRQGVLDFSCGGSGAIPEADAYIAMMDEFSASRPDTAKIGLANTASISPDTAHIIIPTALPDAAGVKLPSPGDSMAHPSVSPDTEITSIKPDREPPPPKQPDPAKSDRESKKTEVKENSVPPDSAPVKETETRRLSAPPAEPRRSGTDTTRLVLRGATSTQEDLRSAPRADNIVINTAAPDTRKLSAPPSTRRLIRDRQVTETDTSLKKTKETERLQTKSQAAKASDTGQKRRTAEQLAARNDIRVDLRKLDSMLDLVGELVIAEAMVTRHPVVWNAENESLERAVHQLRRVASSLQDMATSVRMIPLAPTFRRMTRLVYDLSVKAGKQVDLILLGEETEVDRTVIERISDPLVHIIRNAIDHGIESPEERLAAGKLETGRLTIEGHHEGGEVWIVITDDGRGLNREGILRKAMARGMVHGDGTELSDNQVYHFIFEPGFSTATKVTDISGRGFGMDVVKKNIEKLSGKIDIRTRPGEGTAVVLRIPLTLAIIDGMLVRSGETRYIIPLLSIRESLRPDPTQILSTPDGQEVVKLRDELIPIVRLDETFSRVKSDRALMDGILMIVEGEDGEVVALFADELLGQQETVIKGLSGWLKKSRGVSGCTILGDGEVGLILDIGAIVRLAKQE